MASACVLVECPITGRVLGVARRDNPNAFGLPGGKVDPGETEKQAARRELREETGVVVGDDRSLREVFRRDGGVTYSVNLHEVAVVWAFMPAKAGEPRCDWVTWQQLFDGPFGEYNRKLYAAIGRSHQGA